ncbi:hypothetical protein E1I69_11595 [Bacillus timonensis]|uniref:Uncharacterized protein n=1 Tax=Bacillus timonensis TaxID=1033734 RepID=A0A4S3PS01_9BACI|nr:hypothetical protein [Bacillus timonensis]THE12338.1 hypothetical protein E1I69_11595 [Bacillus timonensis]
MKPLKIEDQELKKAITSGNYYLEVGKRKFMLFEVEEVSDSNVYNVTDEEEENEILEALDEEKNPILSKEEIRRMLDGE